MNCWKVFSLGPLRDKLSIGDITEQCQSKPMHAQPSEHIQQVQITFDVNVHIIEALRVVNVPLSLARTQDSGVKELKQGQ